MGHCKEIDEYRQFTGPAESHKAINSFRGLLEGIALDAEVIVSRAQSQAFDTDALHQLKQLLDEGVITQDDFDKKKAQLLGI